MESSRRQEIAQDKTTGASSGRESPSTLAELALEQAPKKLIDFFDKSLLQHFDFERFLIV
jgi:hypothetical protein